MSTQLPTRAQIDRAEPLDFPDRPARQDLTITVRATIDGFPTEVCFTGSIDQLLQVTRKLRSLGGEPTIAPALHTAPLGNGKPKAQRVEPAYNGAGEACCPKHTGKVLKEGKFGLYCPAKDESTERGFCALKFTES